MSFYLYRLKHSVIVLGSLSMSQDLASSVSAFQPFWILLNSKYFLGHRCMQTIVSFMISLELRIKYETHLLSSCMSEAGLLNCKPSHSWGCFEMDTFNDHNCFSFCAIIGIKRFCFIFWIFNALDSIIFSPYGIMWSPRPKFVKLRISIVPKNGKNWWKALGACMSLSIRIISSGELCENNRASTLEVQVVFSTWTHRSLTLFIFCMIFFLATETVYLDGLHRGETLRVFVVAIYILD